jgi:hypothetical protein
MSRIQLASIVALVLLAGLVTLPQAVFGQGQEPQTFQGQILQVDTDAQTITIENADEMQMTFGYNAQTEVSGDQTVQGLARETGTVVRVTYLPPGQGERAVARQIMVVEEQP